MSDPERLRELVAQGLTESALAREFGVSRTTILRRCTKLGIEPTKQRTPEAVARRDELIREAVEAGRNAREIAYALDLPIRLVQSVLGKKHWKTSPEAVRRAIAQGWAKRAGYEWGAVEFERFVRDSLAGDEEKAKRRNEARARVKGNNPGAPKLSTDEIRRGLDLPGSCSCARCGWASGERPTAREAHQAFERHTCTVAAAA